MQKNFVVNASTKVDIKNECKTSLSIMSYEIRERFREEESIRFYMNDL